MSKRTLIVGIAVLAQACWMPVVFANECSQQEGLLAETSVDHLNSWAKVAQARKQFSTCDDGGIAEGFSEAVARLLARHWSQVTKLVALIHSEPELGTFVVGNLNESDNFDDLRAIRELASHRCPPTAANLCAKLVQRINSLDLSTS